jgi:predicted esterase
MKWLVLALLFNTQSVLAGPLACIGPDRPVGYLVYLHGRDFDPPGELELTNRKNLQKIADTLHVKIALPRGEEVCGGKGPPHCWGWEISEAQAKRALVVAQSAADSCFGPGKNYGVIGFSNGGYIVARIFRSCMKRPDGKTIPWLVSIASAATNPPQSEWPADLSQCGDYTLITGKKDAANQDKDQRFQKPILKRKGHVRAVEFDGGHEVPLDPTLSVISRGVGLISN